jgi:alkanesulfonate monooxygenase SsuD/methylene tetrahydromethanopterin reductase-like flavin-dependent oxidoreductase (luciferase family)
VKLGIMLPMAESDRGEMPRYADIRAIALQVEREGFDSVWLADHLLFRRGDAPARGIWEAWTILSALAEATERVALGTLVVCTAFRNPALLAKMTTALDEVSDGRFILGLGAGWHEPEFTAFGYPYDHLGGRFEDALRIIAPLLRTGEVDYHGRFMRAVDAVNLPRGPRPGGPPLLIGAFKPRMLRLTAELADAWNTCWLGRAAELPERLVALHEACADVGRDPATLELTVGQFATFPDLRRNGNGEDPLAKARFSGPEELAEEFARFAALGVGHLIVWPMPEEARCLELVSRAFQLYRVGAAA